MQLPHYVVTHLLQSPELRMIDKGIYLITASVKPDSITSLSKLAKHSRSMVSGICYRLSKHGWMELLKHKNKVRPIPVIPHQCQEKMIEELEYEYSLTPYKGEFLMKRLLDFWIDSNKFMDNARPEFLTNPATQERLEYDRYYTIGVAFEFNGPQHYGKTELYKDEQAVKEIKVRDLVKQALSRKNGVDLITVSRENLYPEIFETLIPKEIKNQFADKTGPYYRALARISTAYADKGKHAEKEIRPFKGSKSKFS